MPVLVKAWMPGVKLSEAERRRQGDATFGKPAGSEYLACGLGAGAEGTSFSWAIDCRRALMMLDGLGSPSYG